MLTRRWLPAATMAVALTAPALAGDPLAECSSRWATSASQKSSDRCVAVECRVIRLADSYFENDAEGFDPRGKSMVSAEEFDRFLAAVQADPGSGIHAAPKIVMLDGQEATFRQNDVRFFVTRINVTQFDGREVYVPVNQPFNVGMGLTVTPHVLPGGQGIQLDCRTDWSELASDQAPLFPVTSLVTPVFEGGAQGQAIPFTQFLQQPTVQTQAACATRAVPVGGTAVIDLGRLERVVERKKCFPILCDLPLIGELFESTESSTAASRVIVCLTPRVVDEPAPMPPVAACLAPTPCVPAVRRAAAPLPPAVPAPGAVVLAKADEVMMPAAPAMDADAAKRLAFHLDCYRRACAAGLNDEAVEHAHRCLEIDPGCFAKSIGMTH
jgi:hypothetical protein